MSAVAHADELIQIRPGTDVAMMSAMAYVMIEEGLFDKAFVVRYCVGFGVWRRRAGVALEGADGVEKEGHSP